ncbi:SAM-dependent methyltransferase [Actinocrispum sp. NPDC049592]|uniref:SAM-dependent methyltransferase n=1 Tax=Actinocrispum sp. NPDC049592 TaxID=3154835 RepID=UPI00341A69BC
MVSDVSRTAIGVARLRAFESQRPDRLFNDPYAAAFAGTPTDADSVFRLHVAIRTRFYDDYLLSSGCRQVALVAAGLDTRAFRLDWPADTHLFELDLPDLLAYKEKVLTTEGAKPRCERTLVPVDLREDWPTPLVDAGFRPEEPTAWLIEGLLVYLSAEDAAKVLTRVTNLSAPGSTLSCEHRDRERNPNREPATEAMRRLVSLWQGGLGTRNAAWLTDHGWQVTTHDGMALAESYGRAEPGYRVSNFLTAELSPA